MTAVEDIHTRKKSVSVGIFHALWTGVLLWVMVYLSSLVFITDTHNLLVKWETMETWLVVGTTGVGAMMLKYCRPANILGGFILGIFWMAIQITLDQFFMVPTYVSHTRDLTGINYVFNMGLRHANLLFMCMAVGHAVQDALPTKEKLKFENQGRVKIA